MPLLASNRKLLDAFRRGDPAALRDVYLYYAPGLSRSLRSAMSFEGGSGTESFNGFVLPFELADGLQEVFARAFTDRARLSYDGLSPYGAFLAGIARNLVVDHVRRRAAGRAVAVGFAGQVAVQRPADAPDVASEEAEARRLLATFEAGLEPADAGLYRCRFGDGQTQEAAAVALGLTRIQVRRSEAKLRKRLLEFLKDRGYLENSAPRAWGLAPELLARIRRRQAP